MFHDSEGVNRSSAWLQGIDPNKMSRLCVGRGSVDVPMWTPSEVIGEMSGAREVRGILRIRGTATPFLALKSSPIAVMFNWKHMKHFSKCWTEQR